MNKYNVLVPIRWKGKRHDPGKTIMLSDVEVKTINSKLLLVELIEDKKTTEVNIVASDEKVTAPRSSAKKKTNNNNS
jgi:hypothetical protein